MFTKKICIYPGASDFQLSALLCSLQNSQITASYYWTKYDKKQLLNNYSFS